MVSYWCCCCCRCGSSNSAPYNWWASFSALVRPLAVQTNTQKTATLQEPFRLKKIVCVVPPFRAAAVRPDFHPCCLLVYKQISGGAAPSAVTATYSFAGPAATSAATLATPAASDGASPRLLPALAAGLARPSAAAAIAALLPVAGVSRVLPAPPSLSVVIPCSLVLPATTTETIGAASFSSLLTTVGSIALPFFGAASPRPPPPPPPPLPLTTVAAPGVFVSRAATAAAAGAFSAAMSLWCAAAEDSVFAVYRHPALPFFLPSWSSFFSLQTSPVHSFPAKETMFPPTFLENAPFGETCETNNSATSVFPGAASRYSYTSAAADTDSHHDAPKTSSSSTNNNMNKSGDSGSSRNGEKVVGDLLIFRGENSCLQFSFFWNSRRVNLTRSAEESVSRVLQRMQLSCEKILRSCTSNNAQQQIACAEKVKKKKGGLQQQQKSAFVAGTKDASHATRAATTETVLRAAPGGHVFRKIFLRNGNGQILADSMRCDTAFEKAAFLCFEAGESSGANFHSCEKLAAVTAANTAHINAPEIPILEQNDVKEWRLAIVWGPPIPKRVYIQQTLFVGCPALLYVEKESEVDCAIDENLIFEWRRDSEDGPLLCTGNPYIPVEEDLGRRLHLRAYHRRYELFAASCTTSEKVRALPRLSWRDKRRQEFTSSRLPSIATATTERCFAAAVPPANAASSASSSSLAAASLPAVAASSTAAAAACGVFRVCSFNVLAAAYARTPHAVEKMYPYCCSQHLSLLHRKPLLLQELLHLNCQIYALQECSRSFFRSCLLPIFEKSHFCLLSLKQNTARVKEGCALLVEKSFFSLEHHKEISFCKEFAENPLHANLRAEVRQKWPHFETNVLPNLTTVAQIAVLKYRKAPPVGCSDVVIVVNTHLFFHPHAKHIRILQTYVFLHALHHTMMQQHMQQQQRQQGRSVVPETPSSRTGNKSSNKNELFLPSVIFCGDLNSPANAGALLLLLKNKVHAQLSDWDEGPSFKWREEDAEVEGEYELGDIADNQQTAQQQLLQRRQQQDLPFTHQTVGLPEGRVKQEIKELKPQQHVEQQRQPKEQNFSSDVKVEPVEKHSHDSLYDIADENSLLVNGNKAVSAAPAGANIANECIGREVRQASIGLTLEIPPDISLSDCYEEMRLPFTHFIKSFRATLDYIFASKDLKVVGRLPGVTEDEVGAGLPSEGYASDHLSLAVALQPSCPSSNA